MTIQKVFLITLMLLITACAGIMQTATISEAYKKYELQQFKQTLKLIIRAENVTNITPEMKAELTYLKAQTHEGLEQPQIAHQLYKYLIEHHKDSQYSYLASKKLNDKLLIPATL